MKHEKPDATYCKVCLLPHDEVTHQATLDIRKWHRWQVVKGLEDEAAVRQEIEEPRVA